MSWFDVTITHSYTGNKWVEMVPLLQGRTANAIKNRFNATLLPRIRQAGRTMAKTNPDVFERDANGAPVGIPVRIYLHA